MLKKLLATHADGVDGQEAVAKEKAGLLYGALDAHPDAYRVVPARSARSRMNVCFRVTKVNQRCHFRLCEVFPFIQLTQHCREETRTRRRRPF